MTNHTAEIIQLFAPRPKRGKKFNLRVTVSAERPQSTACASSDTAENQRLRRHDRANMQTFLFRSYDLIVKSDEADLIRDVCLDMHKAEVKLKKVRQRLQGIREQSAAQIRLLSAAETKLAAAIAAARATSGKPSETKEEFPAGAPSAEREQAYHDLLEAFGKLDPAGRRAIVSYLKTQATGHD
jgi:hypothetical protein